MTLDEWEKLQQEKRANLNKKPASTEAKVDPKAFEGMKAYTRKTEEEENDLELTSKKSVGARKSGTVEKVRKEASFIPPLMLTLVNTERGSLLRRFWGLCRRRSYRLVSGWEAMRPLVRGAVAGAAAEKGEAWSAIPGTGLLCSRILLQCLAVPCRGERRDRPDREDRPRRNDGPFPPRAENGFRGGRGGMRGGGGERCALSQHLLPFQSSAELRPTMYSQLCLPDNLSGLILEQKVIHLCAIAGHPEEAEVPSQEGMALLRLSTMPAHSPH